MSVGTKSVLFGAHQFLLHPLFVALAWWRLYGFPWDPRLWVAFFVHDLGYWGKPNMDGPEGESHVLLGARVMRRLFGPDWEWFCACHSRFWAKREGRRISRLCVADKFSIVITPEWISVPMMLATGEMGEYQKLARQSGQAGQGPAPKYADMGCYHCDPYRFHAGFVGYFRNWVEDNKDVVRGERDEH